MKKHTQKDYDNFVMGLNDAQYNNWLDFAGNFPRTSQTPKDISKATQAVYFAGLYSRVALAKTGHDPRERGQSAPKLSARYVFINLARKKMPVLWIADYLDLGHAAVLHAINRINTAIEHPKSDIQLNRLLS